MNETRSKPLTVYVGSYAEASEPGIYQYNFDSATGALTLVDSVSGVENPSFLTIDAVNGKLYGVSEAIDTPGKVVSFSIASDTGKISYQNEQSTFGAAPCHVVMDSSRRFLVVSNYSGGNVCLFPIGTDGEIEEATENIVHSGHGVHERQEGPHPHSAVFDATNQFVLVQDLGLDKIKVYQFDADNGKLTFHQEVSLHDGAGPRHFVFHPSNQFAYVVNELDSTITTFIHERGTGGLSAIQTVSTLPADFSGVSYNSDVHISQDGRYLYVSNRGHDSIALFQIDQETGQLRAKDYFSTLGQFPRNFAITPDGAFMLVANQHTDSIVPFRIDSETGRLQAIEEAVVQVAKPVCIKFLTL